MKNIARSYLGRSVTSVILSAYVVAGFVGCTGVASDKATSTSADGRLTLPHAELKIVDPSVSSTGTSKSADAATATALSTDSAKDAVTTINGIAIGTMFLEAQLAPLKVTGTGLQASDITIRDGHVYVAYNAIDTDKEVIKKGAIEQLNPLPCDDPKTIARIEYCVKTTTKIEFPNADIFGITTDGTDLFAVGSTSDESAAPNYARLYKIGLDAATKSPASIKGTTVLPSYAGTGVLALGSSILATSGTSKDAAKMGGLNVVNPSTMKVTASQSLYDARSVAASASAPSSVFVVKGKTDDKNAAGIVEYKADGSGTAIRTISTGGNTIPESKSSVQVGKELLLVSLGDQGFKVMCKATGATLITQPAPVISGISSKLTVTNSVTAAPGYIFAANGEAGLYIYRFSKTSATSKSLCDGVAATLIGRISLDSDDDDLTHLAGELSANSVNYLPIFDIKGVLGAKLVIVAAGNKGVSLLNITSLSLLTTPVDDF